MGFLYGLCNQLRDGSSAITPLTKEEKIENHFMKGKGHILLISNCYSLFFFY